MEENKNTIYPSLPHQPSDIRPDEIIEIEQEPPEEIITEKGLREAKKLEAYKLRPRDVLPLKKKLQELEAREIPSPKTQDYLKKYHKEKTRDFKKARENLREQPISAKKDKPFLIKYLKKLSEYRRTAKHKRAEQVEKNLELVMYYAWRKGEITIDDVKQLVGVKNSQAQRYIKMLEKQGKLIAFNKIKNTFYKPVKN